MSIYEMYSIHEHVYTYENIHIFTYTKYGIRAGVDEACDGASSRMSRSQVETKLHHATKVEAWRHNCLVALLVALLRPVIQKVETTFLSTINLSRSIFLQVLHEAISKQIPATFVTEIASSTPSPPVTKCK